MKHKRGEPQVRRGKWTLEEELYTSKMITLFNQGLLPILSGTTLRSYLSSQLQWYNIHEYYIYIYIITLTSYIIIAIL